MKGYAGMTSSGGDVYKIGNDLAQRAERRAHRAKRGAQRRDFKNWIISKLVGDPIGFKGSRIRVKNPPGMERVRMPVNEARNQ